VSVKEWHQMRDLRVDQPTKLQSEGANDLGLDFNPKLFLLGLEGLEDVGEPQTLTRYEVPRIRIGLGIQSDGLEVRIGHIPHI
jgi:hypothetical protein